MAGYRVARVRDIPPGQRVIVELAGRSIAVFNLGGEFFALRNRCPHQGAALCTGVQVGRLESSAPGEYELSGAGELIRCPWHGWEFEIRTGRSWFDPQHTRVRDYPVSVSRGAAAGAQQRVPGPYTAERYEASVSEDYVVVEL